MANTGSKKHLAPVFVEDALLLGLWIQQVRDKLLERRRDPSCKRLRGGLGQTGRHVTITVHDEGTILLVEVLIRPLGK